jgi:hypothetical protein
MAKDVSMRGLYRLDGRCRQVRVANGQALKQIVKHGATVKDHSAFILRELSRFGRNRPSSATPKGKFPGDTRDREMKRDKKDVRAKQPALASQYRTIGPAAIAAALLHVTRKKKPVQKFIAPRAA